MSDAPSTEIVPVRLDVELVAETRRPERDPALVYLAGLSTEKGRRAQRSALRTIAGLLGVELEQVPWHRLTYAVTNAIRSRLVERFAPATANRCLCALRGVLREARRLGLMNAEEQTAACDLRPARGTRLPPGRALSRADVKRLFRATVADHTAGRRNAAMLAVLLAGGLRRAEVTALDVEHLDRADLSLRVLGKGNKERRVYLETAGPYLDAWLEQRGTEPGPLFFHVTRGGTLQRHRLSDEALAQILKRVGDRAGLQKFTAHDLRRTFVSELIDAGADLSAVQQLAGHASVTTTQRYDRRGEDAKRKAAKLIRLPT